MSLVTDPRDIKLKVGQKNETGQHETYLVLSEEERLKRFVRPVRNSYVHVGKKPRGIKVHQILTEGEMFEKGYVAVLTVMEKPDGSFLGGQYVTQKEFDAWKIGAPTDGCGTLTSMGRELAETYARNPKFYGATYCCGCNKHISVDEFIWDGTNERVGS